MSEARQRAEELVRRHHRCLTSDGTLCDACRKLRDDVAAEVQQAVQQERNEGQVRLANAVQRAKQEQWEIDNERCSQKIVEMERRHAEEIQRAVDGERIK